MSVKVVINDKLKEKLYYKKMKNGMMVFYIPKKNYSKKYAVFSTKYGSNDNYFVPVNKTEPIKVPEGIAHFLEHKLFEQKEGNIFTEFSKLGSYVNAYTNFNQTAYLFSCTDKFCENLKLLLDFVQNPYFTKENIEKEKGIIEQEIKMYEDDPNWKVFFNCLRGMYNKHPVRNDIAGTIESIGQIDKEILYTCYNTFYHPSNMVLFIIGDIDFHKSLDIIDENTDYNEDVDIKIDRIYAEEPKDIKNELIEQKLSVSTPLFNFGFKDNNIGFSGDKLIQKELITGIILEMLLGTSSDFFQNLYDEGLINKNFGARYVGNLSYGHSILGGESDDPKKVIKKVMDRLEFHRNNGFDKKTFIRIKKKFLGYYLMDFNSLEYISNNFISYYFKDSSLIRYIDILKEVRFEDIILRFNEHFSKENCVTSIINPQ